MSNESLIVTSAPRLTETVAVRLSADESRTLHAIARQLDRTVSYVVRKHLRPLLQEQE